jgi:hypothetical protein
MPDTNTKSENVKPESSSTFAEKLLKENLELTRKIFEHTRKTRRYILFAQILNVIKVILIVGPIILAILYLPPLIKQGLGVYTELLGGGTGQTLLEGSSFLENLFGKNSGAQ